VTLIPSILAVDVLDGSSILCLGGGGGSFRQGDKLSADCTYVAPLIATLYDDHVKSMKLSISWRVVIVDQRIQSGFRFAPFFGTESDASKKLLRSRFVNDKKS
jgi:hypothetical protein